MAENGWRENEKEFVKSAIYIRWQVTEKCNFRCNYCEQDHSGKKKIVDFKKVRSLKGLRNYLRYRNRNNAHSFHNFSSDEWLKAFSIFSDKKLSITLTGGEVFLDITNFEPLLTGLSRMENVTSIRIDTNGSWNPRRYKNVEWDKVFLNMSYHPTMISLENYKKMLYSKISCGIKIGMVNYVLAPEQLNEFENLHDEFAKAGITLNANVYFGEKKQTEYGTGLYRKFIPELDITLKTQARSTKGLECYYPSVAYEINPTGFINVGCFPEIFTDFMQGVLPKFFSDKVPCPREYCGCLDKYAFLNISNRGYQYNLLKEYVEICNNIKES